MARRHIPQISGKSDKLVGREVAVAFNRHECLLQHPVKPGEHCFSVREKPTSSSPVIGYADEIWLEDVRFFASESGLRRIQKTGTRTPIAFVVGKVLRRRPASVTKKRGWFKVRFDPFEPGCFFDPRTDSCLASAKYMRLGDRHMEAFGPAEGEAMTSLRQLNPQPPFITPQRETWRGDMGGLNYRDATPAATTAAMRHVWDQWPSAVIVDGTDDWEAPEWARPQLWLKLLGAKPLAIWHTGASGQSASGLVFSPAEWQRAQAAFLRRFGERVPVSTLPKVPTKCGCWDGEGVRVYRQSRESSVDSGSLKRRLMR